MLFFFPYLDCSLESQNLRRPSFSEVSEALRNAEGIVMECVAILGLSLKVQIASQIRFPELSAQPCSLISFDFEALSSACH